MFFEQALAIGVIVFSIVTSALCAMRLEFLSSLFREFFWSFNKIAAFIYTLLHNMAVGDSRKIVIEVDPDFKKKLRKALALNETTLKDWF